MIKVIIEEIVPCQCSDDCEDVIRTHTICETGEHAPDVIKNAIIGYGAIAMETEDDTFVFDLMKGINNYYGTA